MRCVIKWFDCVKTYSCRLRILLKHSHALHFPPPVLVPILPRSLILSSPISALISFLSSSIPALPPPPPQNKIHSSYSSLPASFTASPPSSPCHRPGLFSHPALREGFRFPRADYPAVSCPDRARVWGFLSCFIFMEASYTCYHSARLIKQRA